MERKQEILTLSREDLNKVIEEKVLKPICEKLNKIFIDETKCDICNSSDINAGFLNGIAYTNCEMQIFIRKIKEKL